jgi:1,4-alpha-glucan branching enzyme
MEQPVSYELSSDSDQALDARTRVYTLNQIEMLRKAVPPQYVRVIDWMNYEGEKFLNRGILFTFDGYRKKGAWIAGNFTNWKLEPMIRNRHGVYFFLLTIKNGDDNLNLYTYRFLADEIWTHDPVNRYRRDDGMGGYLSEFRFDAPDIDRVVTVRLIPESVKREERLIEFAIHLPDVSNLSLVGDFNRWNPEHDIAVRGPDGIFRIRLRLKPGEYIYKYIADGKWILDRFNSETRMNLEMDELCSYLKVD